MLISERRQKVLGLLREKGSISVTELSKHFSVSEETIRRDFHQMEKDGLLNRVHGGAYLGNLVQQKVPINLRKETCRVSKEIIASVCSDMIQNGDTIMLDSSTTAFYIAKNILSNKNLIVITNSLDIAYTLASSDFIKVICAGGSLDRDTLSYSDTSALNFIKEYYADKAFVSCTGISIENGLTDSIEAQGLIRNTMLKHSQRRICIADDTKLGKTTLSKIAPLSSIDCLVTNKRPSNEWISELEKRNIEYLYPNKE